MEKKYIWMSVKGFIVLLFKVEKPGYSRWLNCIMSFWYDRCHRIRTVFTSRSLRFHRVSGPDPECIRLIPHIIKENKISTGVEKVLGQAWVEVRT